MKKRLLALTLLLFLLSGLVGCGQKPVDAGAASVSDTQTVNNTQPPDLQPSSEQANTGTPSAEARPETGALHNTGLEEAVVNRPTATPLPVKPVTQNKPAAVEQQVEEPIEKEPDDGQQMEPPVIPAVTKHTPIPETSYYGYARLSPQERKLYSAIRDSVMRAKNVTDVQTIRIGRDSLLRIFSYFLADYPQCFWVTKKVGYSYNHADDTLRFVLLYYTDGTATDELNSLGVPISGHTASRNVIAGQIKTCEQAVKEVADSVSPGLSDWEKARILHDFVLKWTGYDYAAASLTPENGFDSPAFTSYGALVLRSCVCEGYAKLFQYLCYQVGIACLQVQGTSRDGGGHMWNLARLDGKWRHVDVTWDDGQQGGAVCADYFGLTDAQIKADHLIVQGQSYAVPAAA